jgi:hypothetical protein
MRPSGPCTPPRFWVMATSVEPAWNAHRVDEPGLDSVVHGVLGPRPHLRAVARGLLVADAAEEARDELLVVLGFVAAGELRE